MDERAKPGLVILALLATIVSGCYTVREARYLARGLKAPGVATAAYEIKGRHPRGPWRNKRLGVIIDDTGADGRRHTANDTLPPNATPARGDAVVVESIRGEGRSGRPEGNRDDFWAGIFPVAPIASGALVGMLIREAGEPHRKKRRPAPPPGPLRRRTKTA